MEDNQIIQEATGEDEGSLEPFIKAQFKEAIRIAKADEREIISTTYKAAILTMLKELDSNQYEIIVGFVKELQAKLDQAFAKKG